jgi:putative endopeptidase
MRYIFSGTLTSLTACLFCFAQSNEALRFDINAVDKSADPCADFYQYACGGWLKSHPIPPNWSYSDLYQQMTDINDRRVAAILDQAARAPRSENEQRIGDYFSSCLDETDLERRGLTPLRTELDKIDTIKNSNELATELARIHSFGADAMLNVYPDQKLEDATQVIAYLDQSGLNLPEPRYYTSDDADSVKARNAYRAHLQKVFELMGESSESAKVAAVDTLKIETDLSQAELTRVQRRDRQLWYHEMKLVELEKLAPSFPWKTYFGALGLDPAAVINVAVPKYVQALNSLLAILPMDGWKHYLRWELVRAATPELPKRFREAEFDFYQHTLRGVSAESSREQKCTELTNRDLGEAVGKEYVELYFPPSSKTQVLTMVERVEAALRSDIQQANWLSASTKQEAIRKLDLVRVMIGYPEHWRDYSHLTIKRGDALGNLFRAQEFEFQRQLAKIGKPVDRGEFYELPQSVDGYHDNPLNEIVFTAGILQPPFFDPKMDDAINFGLAAAVMGHELSHAFDDKGHLFDGQGNMRNWWTTADAAHYNQRAACFERQYSSYTVIDDIKVNGKLTLGENIADNGGLQLAHMAFANQPHSNASIDGYTPEQRFFLAWAQWRCTNITDERTRQLARTDPHSPGRYRVNGVVSNMPPFAEAYHCKKDDKMVNTEPCRIW